MKLLKIDLKKIIRTRLGEKKGKHVPGFLISGVERLIHQRELNEILETTYPREGSEFAEGVYHYLGTTLEPVGMENIPLKGRFVFASNHPLGGLDGIGLIKVLGKKYGDGNINFLVNDLLLNVEPLKKVFLPINKFGAQGRASASLIDEAYASGRQIIIFPAGLCSRLHPDGKVRDLKWQKSFIAKAIKSGRDIIPVYFEGLNRRRFYRIARWRKRLGIKVNIEQALLPSEVFAARGKHFRVYFGKPISAAELASSGESPAALAEKVKAKVYEMGPD